MTEKNMFKDIDPGIPIGWVFSTEDFTISVYSPDYSFVASKLVVVSDGNVRVPLANPSHDDDLITKKYGDDNYSGGGGGGGDFMADGSVPMTGNFQGGGHRLTAIADGTVYNDAATIGQLATKLDATATAVDSDQLGGQDPAYYATADHLHDDRYFQESEFIDVSAGVGDAGKPILLDSTGQIDPSMLDVSVFYYVAEFTPASGAEYPDTTGHTHGAFWVVQALTGDYTFTGGDLSGRIISNGDFMVWSAAGWSIMASEMNPTLYYRLDGTQALTDPFAGGGQVISNIADGVADTDAATVGQIPTGLGDFMADGSVPMTGDFQGGGNLLTGIADGIADDDAATVGQLPVGGGDFYADGHVPMTGDFKGGMFKITAISDGTADNDGATVGQTKAGLEISTAIASSGGYTSMLLDEATVFQTTLTESTVLTVGGVAPVGNSIAVTLKVVQPSSGAGTYTFSFPDGSMFPDSVLPTFSDTPNAIDVFVLVFGGGVTVPDVYPVAKNMGIPA